MQEGAERPSPRPCMGGGGGGAAAIALAVSHGFALRQPARPRERGVKGEMGRGPAAALDQREASFGEGARFWGTPRRKRDSGKLLRGKGRSVGEGGADGAALPSNSLLAAGVAGRLAQV
jgi:hypothetical protein